MLGHAPVDPDAGVYHLPAPVEQPLHRPMRIEIVWNQRDPTPDLLERFDIETGIAAPRVILRKTKPGPSAIEPIRSVRLVAVCRLQFLVEHRAIGIAHALDLLRRNHAFLKQPFRINLSGGRMRTDLSIHDRLCERRLVALVVTMPPIAEHIDHDRLLELLPELDRHLGAIARQLPDRLH